MSEAVLNNIDQMMLARNAQVDDSIGGDSRAGELRAQQMEARRGGMSTTETEAEAGREQSLRERVMRARRALDLKQRAKDKIEEKVTAPAKMATSALLKSAWLTMPAEVLTLFMPSLLYVNLHVFSRVIFGEAFFCKLGEEWISNVVQGEARKKLEKAVSGLGIIEAGLLFGLDLLVLFLIISALAIIGFVVYAMTAGILETMDIVWGLGAEILKAFAI